VHLYGLSVYSAKPVGVTRTFESFDKFQYCFQTTVIWSNSPFFCNRLYITYLLTPWCRALLEKLTGLQLVKKFPAFHRTRRFITALTSVRQLSLSWTSPIQSIYPHPTSWRFILILSTHLCLGHTSTAYILKIIITIRPLQPQTAGFSQTLHNRGPHLPNLQGKQIVI